MTRLPATIRVGPVQKTVLVFGDRHWEKNLLGTGYSLSEPKPFKTMPLRYERAFGGRDTSFEKKQKVYFDGRNPIGAGFRMNRGAVENTPVANIEDPKHLIQNWKDKPPVANFGFTECFWQPRSALAGTYDQHWAAQQSPLLPMDFKMEFFNAAHPDLIIKGGLEGGEPVQLVNVCPDGVHTFNLPKYDINVIFRMGDQRQLCKPKIWTVAFEPDDHRFYMVWGCSFDVGKQPSPDEICKNRTGLRLAALASIHIGFHRSARRKS